MKKITVVDYLLSKLSDLGINHVFGVPGDYAFPIDDSIETTEGLDWVLCSNELNASYAADGYARLRGAAVLTTTYGVGELSALSGVMGAKAQRVPVFHLTGMPSTRIQKQGLITHHTIGDGNFDYFLPISASSACVSAVLTAENVVLEVERVITEAIRQSKPAYIAIAQDQACQEIIGEPIRGKSIKELQRFRSQTSELEKAVNSLVDMIEQSKKPMAVPGPIIKRYGVSSKVEELLVNTNIPYITLMMGKGVVSENNPNYIGIYSGELTDNKELKEFVEGRDLLIDIGGMVLSDPNTGFWTSKFPENKVLIAENYVQTGTNVYINIDIADVINELSKRLKKRDTEVLPKIAVPSTAESENKNEPLTTAYFYNRLQTAIRESDTVVCETGSCVGPMSKLHLPNGTGYEGQLLWNAIGWGTPATLGVALADESKRVLFVSGDGAHQLTANDIGTMGRYGVAPVIFIINNGVYGIEIIVSDDGHIYDDLAQWNYAKLPEAMGCKDWITAKVKTSGELDNILDQIAQTDKPVYVELIISADESKPLTPALLNYIYKVHPEPLS